MTSTSEQSTICGQAIGLRWLGEVMRRLIKIWFWVSDAISLILIAFGVIGAALYPLVGPVVARMAHKPLPLLAVIGACLLSASIALGAYLFRRRNALSLLFFMPYAAIGLIHGELQVSAVTFGVIMMIFGMPFLLVISQALRAGEGTTAESS